MNTTSKNTAETSTGKSRTTLLNEQAVAHQLSISLATVRRWRLLGQGPRYIKIGAAVRYRPEDLEVWIDTRPMGGERQVER